MWIVRLALRRPYTFVVMALLIAILGGAAIATMPVDIFPYIDIPIVSVVWQYGGLAPEEMEGRIVSNFERALTSNVSGIEHIESQSYQSIAVVRVYFHPNVQIDLALSQIVTQSQVVVRNMPPGTFPPQVLKYDAASVPILMLGFNSRTLNQQEQFDLANNFVRTGLSIVQGATVSYPFGGKSRQIMVDLNTDELYAKGLSPSDVSNALGLQNLIIPAGTAKFAGTEYPIRVSSSPPLVSQFNDLPIKTVNGATVYMKDVATVHDGFSPQHEYRPHQRKRRSSAHRHAQRQRLDAGHRQRDQGRAAENHGDRAFGAEAVHFRRSERVRARRGDGRPEGDADRGFPHRDRDPVVPGELAQHLDRVHFHSAFDPDLHLRAQPVSRNHQRDDAGRTGAGGGHIGGRRDGGNREYPSQSGNEEAPGARRAGWSFADRRSDPGFHAYRSASCSFRCCC